MSKYDFSKITTDELRKAVEYYNTKEGNHACWDISCSNCPLEVTALCIPLNTSLINYLFKEELNRRLEVKQHKEITKDMTIDEFMSLDLDRIEFSVPRGWLLTGVNHATILGNIKFNAIKYRYRLKPKPEVVLTEEIFDTLKSVHGLLSAGREIKCQLEKIYECNITLIEGDTE